MLACASKVEATRKQANASFICIYIFEKPMSATPRNQPCPCGSGMKYKHCCANRSTPYNKAGPVARSPFNPAATLQLAMQHHQAGRLHEAEMLYEQLIRIEPNHPDILHLLGLVNHQLGKNEAACAFISKATKLKPDAPHYLNNLGEVYRALNRLAEAQACYERVVVLHPAHAEAHRNLGLVFLAMGQTDRAITHLRESISRFPHYPGIYWALGLALSTLGQFDEAINYFDKVLAQNPDDSAALCAKGVALKNKGDVDKALQHYRQAICLRPTIPELHHNLALIYQSLGKLPEAEACFERALELRPDNEMARHLLFALRNITPDRAPPSYIRDTFDSYAENFDTHLVDHLQYRTPEMLAQLIQKTPTPAHRMLNILDLGCGTGLFGEQVKHIKQRLVGIDLSSKMIAKAQERHIYDELIVGDLLDYMATATAGQFQLIVATDVFNYVGNLLPVFQQAANLLEPGSWFAFSLEAAANDTSDFTLDKTGRYQHSRTYVPRLCEEHGFEKLDFAQSTLRMDGSKPVTGYLYLLKKSGPAN